MVSTVSRFAFVAIGFMAITVSGCTQYVKKTDYDAAISELRANDQKQQQQLDELMQEMKQKFAQYDAKIAEMGGRVRVDAIAHFAFDQATLRDEDKPLLDDFAKVVRAHYPEALVTVEGFADPAGSSAYNVRLGARRAAAVQDYLVGTGGLSADKVRTVSYGEAVNRQVDPGKTHDEGMDNRRVTLVVDFAGTPAAAP
ncbi:MAG: OmpA family protein [Rhodanobacter sp.]|jgi:peptidoglycan-associated lipoprotein|nr:OmpA family protein [Rhodanobacter sp.]